MLWLIVYQPSNPWVTKFEKSWVFPRSHYRCCFWHDLGIFGKFPPNFLLVINESFNTNIPKNVSNVQITKYKCFQILSVITKYSCNQLELLPSLVTVGNCNWTELALLSMSMFLRWTAVNAFQPSADSTVQVARTSPYMPRVSVQWSHKLYNDPWNRQSSTKPYSF